ncbi:MAG: glycosyltransferase family 39 protein [Chloroflexi bacterium]|nr:glycosyltransferase family 39 protein [Chloroflexota bacterium]
MHLSMATLEAGLSGVEAPFIPAGLEYYGDIHRVDTSFLATYVADMGELSLHGRTHPPGPILLLWGFSRLLGGSRLAAASAVACLSALAAVPVYLLARQVLLDAGQALLAAFLFLLTPNVILYSATSMDSAILFFSAWTLYCAWEGLRQASLRWAVLAGLAYALTLFMTFTVAFLSLFLGLLFLLLWLRGPGRRVRRLWALMAMGVMVVICYFVLAVSTGFNVLACFQRAWELNQTSIAVLRPYDYWLVGNLVAYAAWLGFASWPLLGAQLRQMVQRCCRGGLLQGSEAMLLAAVGTALIWDLSGLIRGEVGRVWLFLVPTLVIPAARRLAAWLAEVRSRIPLYVCASLLFGQALLFELLLNTYW